MAGFNVKKNHGRKVTGSSVGEENVDVHKILTAIIKVNIGGYVPTDVDLRSRIDDHLFTAEFESGVLERLEEDEGVESVAISEALGIIEQ